MANRLSPEYLSLLRKYGASDRLLNAAGGRPLPAWPPVVALRFMAVGLCLLFAVIVSYVVTGPPPPTKLSSVARMSANTAAAFSPDGTLIALVVSDGRVELHAADSGALLRTLDTDAASAWFSPDGRGLAVISRSGQDVQLWDTATGVRSRPVVVGSGSFACTEVRFSPDNRTVAVVCPNLGTRLWDLTTRRSVAELGPGATAAFSPDGRTLALAGPTGSVSTLGGAEAVLWDVTDTDRPRRLEATSLEQLGHLAFSPDGRVLAVVGADSTTFFTIEGNRLGNDPVRVELSSSLSALPGFTTDGKRLVIAGPDGAAHVIDVKRHRPATVDSPRQPLTALTFAGDRVAAVGADGTLLRQVSTGRGAG